MNRHLIEDQEYRDLPFGEGLTKSIFTFIINSLFYFVHIYVSRVAFFSTITDHGASDIPFNLVQLYREIASFKFS